MNFKLTLPSHCHFCRDELRRVPFRGFELVRILYGVRRYYCPHCFQIVPRAGMVVLARMAGGATGGMGGAFAESVARWHAAAALVFAAPMLPLLACLSWYFRRRIGGVTGDCLGASNQIQEIAILLAGACL